MSQSTLSTPSAPNRFQAVFDQIANGAIEREQNRILPYDAVDLCAKVVLPPSVFLKNWGARIYLYGKHFAFW